MRGPVPADALWGKLEMSDDRVVAWHPLTDHCVDVACVTEALLRDSLLGARLATLAGQPGFSPATVARLAVVAGLHDIGKLNPGFQARGHVSRAPIVGHVKPGLALLEEGQLGRDLARLLLSKGVFGWFSDPNALLPLRAAIGHHGRLPKLDEEARRAWTDRRVALERIGDLIEVLLAGFPESGSPDAPQLPAGETPSHAGGEPTFGFLHAWAGLIMLADWLGSDRAVFPYAEPGDPPRAETSRARAADLLRATGLRADSRPRSPAAFRDVVGREPRAAQSALFDLSLPDGPTRVVLEAETGSGKTEAAFAHFAKLYTAGRVDGMYFAVPTRAAATQLHERVARLAKAWFGEGRAPPTVLAVPGLLRVDDVEAVRLARFEVLWNDDPVAASRHRYWAGEHSKRFLAGAIGVGTIDQALLGALRVDHAHMRSTALLRQLLVVDEVHASDAYMTTLLRELLNRQYAAGGHALLLSATLESNRREQLLARPGARRPAAISVASAGAEPFPRVGVTGHPPVAVALEGRLKEVDVELAEIAGEPQAVARLAISAARAGARVLVIRNTVKDCVAVQVALVDEAPEVSLRCAGVPAPHHSRYIPEDRRLLDAAVERALAVSGPHGPGVACVATQTVEQSLDIDADLLITDLCPIDVLLQRIGRLHRHERQDRPDRFVSARCLVLAPSEPLASGIDPTGRATGARHGLGTVYRDVTMAEASRRVVSARPRWQIPTDNRWLVEEGLHPERLLELARACGLEAHHLKVDGEDAARGTAAALGAWSYRDPLDRVGMEPEEQVLGTRWSEDDGDDRLVDLPGGPHVSPFGQPLVQLRIPAFFLRGVSLDAEVRAEAGADGLAVSVGDVRFVYGACGLVREA